MSRGIFCIPETERAAVIPRPGGFYIPIASINRFNESRITNTTGVSPRGVLYYPRASIFQEEDERRYVREVQRNRVRPLYYIFLVLSTHSIIEITVDARRVASRWLSIEPYSSGPFENYRYIVFVPFIAFFASPLLCRALGCRGSREAVTRWAENENRSPSLLFLSRSFLPFFLSVEPRISPFASGIK